MKMTAFRNVVLAVAFAFAIVPVFGHTDSPLAGNLAGQVRHQLVTSPYYGVFDDLSYSVDNGVVTLSGAVTNPVLKNDVERSVKRLPGVTQVIDNIRVLPVSSFDNRIRRALYRTIYGSGGLYRYALGTLPSIHIIVDNGHVTLTGVVENEADKNLANIRANTVPGVFSVTNNLRVVEKS